MSVATKIMIALFFLPFLSYADVTSGLVLGYAFERVEKNRLIDSSPSKIEGLLVGTPVPPQLAKSANGKGKSLSIRLDHKQYVHVADADPLDVNKFTITAWINISGKVNADDPRWEVLEKAGAYWMNIRTSDRKIRVGGFFNGCDGDPGVAWRYLDSDTAVTPNQWTHVAGTYDGSSLKLYINGTLDKTLAVTGNVCSNNDVLAIGGKFKPSGPIWEAFWDGFMDELRIYNRALTVTEINTVKNSSLAP